MTKRIWTPAARQLLFERIVEQFGPYEEWPSQTTPGRNQDQWRNFLEAFAVVVGAKGGDAVLMQVKFGQPVNNTAESAGHHWSTGHAETAIFCQAAALDAGHIRHAPDLSATMRRDKKTEAA